MKRHCREPRPVYDRFGQVIKYEVVHDNIDEWFEVTAKIAALRVSSCVVKVLSHYKPPPGTAVKGTVVYVSPARRPFGEHVKFFYGSGVIIECEEAGDGTYITTVLTHANLFFRRNCAPVQPNEVEVEVSLLDGQLCKSEVLACDFHYNLAALRIVTDQPLQPAKIRCLDDSISIDPTKLLHLPEERSFHLRPRPNLFKIVPGDKVIALGRVGKGLNSLYVGCGNFSMDCSSLNCKELCCVTGIRGNEYNGGPVINYSGEMIGIMFHNSSFLPSNIVSRWWKHYKSCREFRRPCIGFGVANLHTVNAAGFLEQLIRNFPKASTGVLVKEVEQDSPAYCSGIRNSDVILQCDGVKVRSTLEFFEKIWDKVGESVELKVLRVGRGRQLNLTTIIGEVTPDKFYRWLPGYSELYGTPDDYSSALNLSLQATKRSKK